MGLNLKLIIIKGQGQVSSEEFAKKVKLGEAEKIESPVPVLALCPHRDKLL